MACRSVDISRVKHFYSSLRAWSSRHAMYLLTYETGSVWHASGSRKVTAYWAANIGMALASVRGDGDDRRQPVRRESHLQPLPAQLPVGEPVALISHLHQDGAQTS